MKLGIFEAHLNVCRASDGDFWSKIRRAICSTLGTEDEDDEDTDFDCTNLKNHFRRKIAVGNSIYEEAWILNMKSTIKYRV